MRRMRGMSASSSFGGTAGRPPMTGQPGPEQLGHSCSSAALLRGLGCKRDVLSSAHTPRTNSTRPCQIA